MKALLRLAQLPFIPQSTDVALLLLRLWVAVPMILFHGWKKFTGFSEMSQSFPDPLGVGSTVSLALAVLGEVVGSLLIVLGLFTRLSAVLGLITMAVAFFIVHGAKLPPTEGHGEMALLYMGFYAILLFAGAGRFSVDAALKR